MKRHNELPEVEPVKLKPLFGMKPGLYLFILYLVVFLLVLFLIGFLPGIVNGGKYVNFSSPLSSSGIYVDDIYQGSADYQYFVTSGTHRIKVEKAGIVVYEGTIKVGHPVFLTWLFHRTQDCPTGLNDLDEGQKKQIIAFDLQEVANISAITTFNEVTRYRPVFTNLQKDQKALKTDESVLGLAFNFISNKEMLDEATLLGTNDTMGTKAMEQAKNLFDSNQSGITGKAKAKVETQRTRTTLQSGDFVQDGITYQASDFIMGDQVESIYPITNEAGVKVHTDAFILSTTPVSQYQWALFLQDNPQWAKDKSDVLVAEELADENYLKGITPTVLFSGSRPITNISYHAAKSFCQWLSEKSGKEVFLPSESEWTLASLSASKKEFTKSMSFSDDGSDTPSGMWGGVWEMTSTPFIPLARLTDYQKVQDAFLATGAQSDIVLKGGSFQNQDITTESVGAIRQDACGETIGFRIAWKEKK